jgi:transcriptional regulator with XRE-family HTH domain
VAERTANERLRARREAMESPRLPGARLSRAELAELVNAWLAGNTMRAGALDESAIARLEQGRVRWPNRDYRAAFRAVLGAETDEQLGFRPSNRRSVVPMSAELDAGFNDEAAALDLAHRIAATDVGDETLTRLELTFDDLATAYPVTPPAELLARIRTYLRYVTTLLDGRKTLAEHRRLLVVGGWLSLLAGTVHIDLNQQHAATAQLRTAVKFAQHAEHNEIHAWCYETEAWRVLTDGDYAHALELSRAAQRLAPKGSSAAVQSVAQEGRASARLGQRKETYDAIARVQKLVSPMAKPDRPEHHYRYDPNKSVAYAATTLAWVGDPAAEGYAREIIIKLKPGKEVSTWPRRVAAANLDLALTLLVTDRLDEACHSAGNAIASGRVVPSNHWRAAEVVQAVEARKLPEAAALREAYEDLLRGRIAGE